MLRTTIQPQAAQSSLLLLETIYPRSMSNHRSVAVEISGPLNLPAFNAALEQVVARHEMLRVRVTDANQGPAFVANPADKNDFALPLKILDATQVQPSPPIENLYQTLREIHEQKFIDDPFFIFTGPLWRSALIKISEFKHQFTMLFNHIIVDESSIGIIFKDLSTFYNALLSRTTPKLDLLPSLSELQFDPTPDEKKKRLEFWQTELNELSTINLQTDQPPNTSFKFNGKRKKFALTLPLVKKLEGLPQFKGASLNQIILAGVYSLLYRYSGGETDICIGITSANRRHKAIDSKITEQLVSCFFNSVPMRLKFTKDTLFTGLLGQVKSTLSDALKNQLPADSIFQDALSSSTKSTLRTASPFNVLVVLNKRKPTLTLTDTVASSPIELDLGRSKFPYFGINLDELDDGSYNCFIEYNTDLYNENTIARLAGHLIKTLEFVAEHPDCKVSTVPFVLDEEKELLAQYNKTEQTETTPDLIPDFFHATALAHPDKIALVYHDETGNEEKLTYRQLDERTNQLANYLRSMGVEPNKTVGVCVTRSANLVIAMLATLKAGGIMVTMETEESPMLTHKIAETKPTIIITDNQTTQLFKLNGEIAVTKNINLQDAATEQLVAGAGPHFTSPPLKPSDVAYIMYTSGTSGERPAPKGAMITHGGFANLLNALFDQELAVNTKIISTALPTFDAFLYDFLVALAATGELHLCFESGRYSPSVLENIIRRANINYGVFLPQTLDLLDAQLPLTRVISMGAMPHEDTMERWAAARPDRQVMNGLGHTETAICLMLHRHTPGNDSLLIGKPIRNMQVFVLHPEDLSLCPLGIPGEIYVAGPGVAAGYVNNEALNRDKFPLMYFDEQAGHFVKCASQTEQSNAIRFYASGDYGCYQLLQNNSVAVKFIGRKDRLLKIHGVRVDLDETEIILRNCPLLKDVAILCDSDNTSLTAYVVAKTKMPEDHLLQQVHEYLSSTLLASVAHPNRFIVLDVLPLTPNGKINIRALAIPTTKQATPIAGPVSELQNKLRAIWASVLKRPAAQLDIHKSFRQLGGHSLSLAKLEVMLNLNFILSSHVGINLLSKHMTIARLAENLKPFLSQPEEKPVMLQPNVYITNNNLLLYPRRRTVKHSATTADHSPTRPLQLASTSTSPELQPTGTGAESTANPPVILPQNTYK